MTKGHSGQIKKAVQLLLEAKRPMIYAGGGVILNNAAPQLTRLTRLLGFPCTTTLMGLGGFPGTDPQFTGLPGMHGTYETNMAMQNCDVLIAVGARFDDRVIGNPSHFYRADRKIIHIDIDPSSISKRVKVDVPIVGYVADVLEEMLKLIESSNARPDPAALKSWWGEIKEWQRKDCLKYDRKSGLIKPQYVVEKLYEITKGDIFITSDVGQHQMWVAQYYKFDKPRRWINSGGLGTMGFGLPAAMGVQLVNPGATVACVTGEASIQMCIQELSTCKQYHLPIKIVNLNNRYMGMVRQWQEFFYGNRYAESYMDALPDFVKLAEAYGHVGIKVEKPGDVEGALEGSVRAEAAPGLPRLHHRSDRERVSDGSGRQGAYRNDPGRGALEAARDAMRHILSILVENEAGALSRISGLFSARGYNIESLTVAPTEDATLSRMTIVTVGSDDVVEQITKQLNKLVEVVKVVDLTDGNHIERELMLVKVRAAGKDREEMKRLADIFRGRILDVTDKSFTIELTGTGSKLDAFLQAIEPGAILETVRTGASGIGRGERVLRI